MLPRSLRWKQVMQPQPNPNQPQYNPQIPSQYNPNTGPFSMQGFYVSPEQIYTAVMSMTGKVDTLIMQHTDVRTDLNDHETRLRSLESSRWPLPTVSVLFALASLVIAVYVAFGK